MVCCIVRDYHQSCVIAMNLEKIRVVLVETSHPGNIGSTARAMKTMGLTKLYLVKPRYFPDSKAVELAAGADDILENAVCVETLDEALCGTYCVFMTSARPRDIALTMVTPEAAVTAAMEFAPDTEIALVFGRERIGLLNEELLKGHYHIEIPTNPDYSSLNLSQAVQIVAYEFAKKHHEKKDMLEGGEAIAPHEQVEQFYHHLEVVLKDIEFIKPSNPKHVMYRLRRLFNRARLEEKEVNILRGILKQVIYTLSRQRNGTE